MLLLVLAAIFAILGGISWIGSLVWMFDLKVMDENGKNVRTKLYICWFWCAVSVVLWFGGVLYATKFITDRL